MSVADVGPPGGCWAARRTHGDQPQSPMQIRRVFEVGKPTLTLTWIIWKSSLAGKRFRGISPTSMERYRELDAVLRPVQPIQHRFQAPAAHENGGTEHCQSVLSPRKRFPKAARDAGHRVSPGERLRRRDSVGPRLAAGQDLQNVASRATLAGTETSQDVTDVQRIHGPVAVLIGGVAVRVAGAHRTAEAG